MLVLDASVIVKWFNREEFTDKALEFRQKLITGELAVAVPYLLVYEIANSLRYNPSFVQDDVRKAVASLYAIGIDIMAPTPIAINAAVEICFLYGTSVYDAVYIALAKELKSVFVTADKKLYEKTKSLGLVEFIGRM